MSTILRHCLGVLVLALLAGCLAQSSGPFYTADSRIAAPQLEGEWDLVRLGKEDLTKQSIRPWVITREGESQYQLDCYNKDNVAGQLTVVFFKVGETMFCDTIAGELSPPAKPNEFWAFHVRPVHLVLKLDFKDDVLTARPLDSSWLAKAIEQKEVSLPFVKAEANDLPLYTATPAQWQTFLKAQSANPNAFPDNAVYVLRKRTPAEKPGSK